MVRHEVYVTVPQRMSEAAQLTSGSSTIWLESEEQRQYTSHEAGTSLGRRLGSGTLLGPEGSAISLDHLKSPHGDGGWYRPYFENFTVDASIFVVTTSY